jgi:hypothetical protein
VKNRVTHWIGIAVLNVGAFWAATVLALAGSSSPLVYEGGLISISAGSYSREELIELVSNAAGFEIVRIGSLEGDEKIIAGFERRKPEAIVRSLLNGQSYAIIYSGRGAMKRMAQRGVSQPEPDSPAAEITQPLWPPLLEDISESASPRERRLKSQIADLKSRIASGRSDQAYETWASVRDPRYVVHEEEQLEQLEKELGAIQPYD